MNDQLQKVLADLAAKFGTSVEHLWRVLVYQAKIEVLCDLGYYSIAIIMAIVLLRLHVKFSKKITVAPTNQYSSETTSSYYEDNSSSGFIIAIFAGMWLILTIWCLTSIEGTISAALNPEYWALKQILNK